MLKVFHFSNKPPYPSKDGGCIAISNILDMLVSTDQIEVFHFTLATHKHPFEIKAYPQELRNKARIEAIDINTKPNVFNALKCLLQNKSYNVDRFHDKAVERKLTSILEAHQFDTAVLESIYLLPYLHLFKNKQIKTVVRTHNAEHQIWEAMAENSNSVLKKWYFNQLTNQLKDFEKSESAKVDGIIAITEKDAGFFNKNVPNVQTISLPTSFEINNIHQDYTLNDFYFLGAMDWAPNSEGVQWFLKKVIPNGFHGKNKFFLAGRKLEKNHIQHPDVEVLGEVNSATDFICQHGICVIPICSGSGVKIKLLENMSLGKPIITTSEGARGVDVAHKKEVLIANTPEEFIRQMKLLQSDIELRKYLGKNAQSFIQDNFNQTTLTKKLIEFIK